MPTDIQRMILRLGIEVLATMTRLGVETLLPDWGVLFGSFFKTIDMKEEMRKIDEGE